MTRYRHVWKNKNTNTSSPQSQSNSTTCNLGTDPDAIYACQNPQYSFPSSYLVSSELLAPISSLVVNTSIYKPIPVKYDHIFWIHNRYSKCTSIVHCCLTAMSQQRPYFLSKIPFNLNYRILWNSIGINL